MAESLKRNTDGTFEYLNAEDSKVYAEVHDSNDPKDQNLKTLLERLAACSRAAHRASRY